MNQPGAEPLPTPRRKSRIRMRILVAGVVALSMVVLVLGLPGDEWGAGRPLDRCITERAVLAFLDGKTVLGSSSADAAGKRVATITLRKERISSLKIRSADPPSIYVRFNLDREGKQHLVEGYFVFTTSDSPELHYHGWNLFEGHVVSSQ
jgi:hypothetical protein